MLTRQSSANNLLKSPECQENIDKQKDLFTAEPNFNEDRENDEPRGSFVGTEDYISPEVVNSEPSSFASDLWSLGVIIFQLFTGKTPFKSDGEQSTLDKILACDYEMPSVDKIPQDAQDLIKKLLVLDPCARLGSWPDD